MDLDTYLTATFCLFDDFLAGLKLRSRGPQPRLHDSEVLTVEIAGEFLGFDTDAGIFRYFRLHHRALFPRLQRIHRFARAKRCHALREPSAWGYDAVAHGSFLGYRICGRSLESSCWPPSRRPRTRGSPGPSGSS